MNIKFSDKAYNITKSIAQVILPGLGTLYVALGLIWGPHVFPATDNVSKTVIAVDAFLGILLSLSSVSYKASDARFDGSMALENHPDGGAQVRLIGLEPQALVTKDSLTLRVINQTTPDPDAVVPNATDPRLLR